MLDILKMAAPPKVAVDAYTVADAIELLKGDPTPNERILILAKTPKAILAW